MLYEIDKLAVELTAPDASQEHPARAILIIGKKSTARKRKEIIKMSSMSNVTDNTTAFYRERFTFIRLLGQVYDNVEWRNMHYYVGDVSNYNDITAQMFQLRIVYDDVFVRCYRVPAVKQLCRMDRISVLFTNIERTKNSLIKLRERFDICLRHKTCVEATSEEIGVVPRLSQLQDALASEWTYTRQNVLTTFEALDLTVYRQTTNDANANIDTCNETLEGY